MGKLKVIIGIDIGVTGAIAVVSNKVIGLQLYDIPIIKIELKSKLPSRINKKGEEISSRYKRRSIYDEIQLANILRTLNHRYKIEHVCIERPIAIGKQTILTAASNFEGFGYIKGLLYGYGIRYTPIEPKVWTKYFFEPIKKNEGETSSAFKRRKKSRSIVHAKRCFPKMTNRIANNDGYADALLIALYKYDELYNNGAPL